MKSFKTVFLYELNKYFKAKGYLILTIVLMLGVAITVFFPRIKSSIFQKEASETKKKIVWVSLPEDIQDTENTQKQDLYLLSFTKMFPAASVEIVETTEENIWKAIEDESVTCAFVLTDLQSYTYYTNNIGLYDSNTEAADEAIREAYTAASLQDAGISVDQIRTILDVNVSHEIRSLGKDQRENFMYTYVMIMTLYMVIVFYGQGVATGVASEKDSRAMELLVTSVKPTPMIFGKILSASVAGIVQIICVFGTAILSFRFNGAYWEGNSVIRSLFNVPASLLGYMLLFFVLGFFIYAFLYGATGSTVTKMEEAGQATLPVTLVFIAGFLITIQTFSGDAINSLPAKVFSFIPFTSPMVMFARIAMSVVPPGEIFLSVAILIITAILIGILSAKIYRAGILIYGTRPKLGTLVKIVLNAK